jgi:hypothetical protein
MWAVLPLLTPWRGDVRRNSQPYYIGRNASITEYGFALYVKQVLESRGVKCHVEILEG